MKVLHVVSSIEAETSGPSYSVPRLCRALASSGIDVELFSSGASLDINREGFRDRRFESDLQWLPPSKRLGCSKAMRAAIKSSDALVFHSHGLWMMPNIYPAREAQRRTCPLVIAPRGMLDPAALAFSRVKKQFFWSIFQNTSLRSAHCFHATSFKEYEDIRSLGFKQPVAIIPNGIDLPDETIIKSGVEFDGPFVLSLGRIHPKKGLARLIAAWKRVTTEFPQWRLKIVGQSEVGHAEELKRLVHQLGLRSVEICGPIFGDEKFRLMAQAELFVLPTLGENFAMTVAESLAHGTPVISTKGAPWSGLQIERCGWWIDHGVEAMTYTLRTAMQISSDERQAMGIRGRAWMARDYDWAAIAGQVLGLYRWASQGGPAPACLEFR